MKIEPENLQATPKGASPFKYSRDEIEAAVTKLAAAVQVTAETNEAAETMGWSVAASDQSIVR